MNPIFAEHNSLMYLGPQKFSHAPAGAMTYLWCDVNRLLGLTGMVKFRRPFTTSHL